MVEIDVTDYVESRKTYLRVGELLGENRRLYEKVLQNQEEIKTLITKGWGY